jgi:ATP-dependent Clp protease ATP-binding subunit ClpA
MFPSAVTVVFSSIVALGLLLLSPQPTGFDADSCKRLRLSLEKEVFGQGFASTQFTSAICDHLWDTSEERPLKPLVLSIHGPPGVGKSFTHFVAAHALYNVTSTLTSYNNNTKDHKKKTKKAQHTGTLTCPGPACPGYRVVYGLDYTLQDRGKQSEALMHKLLSHLSSHPNSLVVIEEYDKLDCNSRGVLKQIFDQGFALNVTMQRSIFLLESNTGYGKIVEALNKVEGRQEEVDPEKLQYTLKNMMFNLWQSDRCEDRVDTVKSLSLVDMFVPYFPLDRSAISKIIDKSIQKRVDMVNRARERPITVAMSDAVLDFLVSKIEWDGQYAVEGGKEVATVIRRHVFGPLYQLTEEEEEGEGEVCKEKEENSEKKANHQVALASPPAALEFVFEMDEAGRSVILRKKV